MREPNIGKHFALPVVGIPIQKEPIRPPNCFTKNPIFPTCPLETGDCGRLCPPVGNTVTGGNSPSAENQ